MLDLWAAGRTAAAIADETGASVEAVRSIVAAARAAGDARAIHHDPGSQPTWTAERITRLKALWTEGLSCSQIARLMGEGATRNAVIGKVHRLKLPTRQAPARVKRRPPNGAQIAARLKARRETQRAAAIPAAPVAAAGASPARAIPAGRMAVPPAPAADANPVRLVERGDRQCGFVIGEAAAGDTLMCGAAKAFGEPYCDHHNEIAYVEPAPSWSAERRARFFLARARRLAVEAAPTPPVRDQPEPPAPPPVTLPGKAA